MSAEGLDELEIKLDQLADVDLNKAIGNAIQTVRSAAVMNVHVDTGELRQSMESSWLRMGSIPSRTKRALQKTWMSSWRLRQRLVSILFLRKRLRNVMIHVMMP